MASRDGGSWIGRALVTLTSCALMIGVAPSARATDSRSGGAPGTALGRGLWASRYDGGVDGYDVALAIAAGPDASQVFVTGESTGFATDYDYATIAYGAATGARQWVARYNGLESGIDIPVGVQVSRDGSKVFVTGASVEAPGESDATTIAYDAVTGDQVWIANYPNAGASGISLSPDGSKVFVTGSGTGEFTEQDYATIAYDADTGTQLWDATYDRDGSEDRANALSVSPDGSKVFVTGESLYFESYFDYATIAYDAATGTQLWVSRYDGGALDVDQANAVGVSPDGSKVFVTGDSSGGDVTVKDYATVAYDAGTGVRLWVTRYNGPGNMDDYPYDLGVSPDGSKVFVTGLPATIAYDAASGTQIWLSTGFGSHAVTGLALDMRPDGLRLYVAGTTLGAGFDFGTVAYDPTTGAGVWIAKLGGPGSDAAHDVAASPLGSALFVTGSVQVNEVGFGDYVTAAHTP
jgi:outer membrane protein assembly factor BamB